MSVRKPKKSAVLVIGGAGYIGSHTAKLLAARGHKVVILDNLSTGHRKAARHGLFVKGNYGNTKLVAGLIKRHKIESVLHFGAKALVGESVQNPLLYYEENVAGAVKLLRAVAESGVKSFVFSSTCATFGEPTEVPIHENIRQQPVNPYGQSKLMIEQILKDMDQRYGVRSVVLRYFNAAGADPEGELGEDHAPETHLIPIALRTLLPKAKPAQLTVFGNDYPTRDGTCIRDYVHINDLAEAHVLAMKFIAEHDRSEHFNLGTEKGYSVLEILKSIEKISGLAVPHTIGARRPGDPAVLIANSTKARETLGWTPSHDLDSIIQTAWAWMKKHPKGYSK